VLEAITASRLEIRGGDGQTLTLVRRDEAWGLEEAGGYPVAAGKVDTLIADLQALMVRRPVVTSGRYHASLGVEENGAEARIRIWEASTDEARVDLFVGNSPAYRTSHVRLGSETPVYEVKGLAAYDVRPQGSAWVERTLIDATPGRVTGLTLANAEGTFSLEKDGDSWKVVSPAGETGRTLDQDKVDSLLRAAVPLNLADPVGPVDEAVHGFTTPAATVTLHVAPLAAANETEEPPPPEEIVLMVGGVPEGQDTHRYVSRSGFGFTATVWENSVKPLLEQTLDDL
jgi:hypothetical protein